MRVRRMMRAASQRPPSQCSSVDRLQSGDGGMRSDQDEGGSLLLSSSPLLSFTFLSFPFSLLLFSLPGSLEMSLSHAHTIKKNKHLPELCLDQLLGTDSFVI